MEEEGPIIDPSHLEWTFVAVLRCCYCYKTRKDKATNNHYQVLYLVEWAPNCGSLYTWTTAECMEDAVFTVQSHVIDWCVVEDNNCGSSVPVELWKYDGDWPLEAPSEDGAEQEKANYDWVEKLPPGLLKEMVAQTLGDSASANQNNSADSPHSSPLDPVLSPSPTTTLQQGNLGSSAAKPTVAQEHQDFEEIEVQQEDDEEQHLFAELADSAGSGAAAAAPAAAAAGKKRERDAASTGILQLLKAVSLGMEQNQAQRRDAYNLIFTGITTRSSELVNAYLGRRTHENDSSPFQAKVTFKITPTLEQIVEQRVPSSTLCVTGFIQFTCCSTKVSEQKLGVIFLQLPTLLASIAESSSESVTALQDVIMKGKTAYQFASLNSILSRHERSIHHNLAVPDPSAAAAVASSTRSKRAKLRVASVPTPPSLQMTSSPAGKSASSAFVLPSLSVLHSPTSVQPGLDKHAALCLFRSYILTVGTDDLLKSQLHQKQFKHPQAVGFYALSADRWQSLLLKSSYFIVHSPLGSLFQFLVCGTIQVPGSQNTIDIVKMQLNYDLVFSKGLAYLQGACIEALKLVIHNYKVTMPALNSQTKLNLASSSDPITSVTLPMFSAAALKTNGRAKEGQFNDPMAVQWCMQAYILFLKNLFSASSSSWSSSSTSSSTWDLTLQLTNTLAVINHHGCMLIRALSAMKNSVRAFTLSESRTEIWGFVLRLKEVLSQGALKYAPVVSALYAAHLQSKENSATLAFPNLLKHLFGSGQRSFDLLEDLRGYIIAAGSITQGPHRDDVWGRCVFLPPHLAYTMLDVSALASYFTSAFCILSGRPRLIITSDKTSLATAPDSFPLPKQVHLALVLFYMYRQYVLSLPKWTTVAAQLKPKCVSGKQLPPSMEDDPKTIHCLFPLFLVEHSTSTVESPVFTVCNNTQKTSQVTFQALTTVLQFGIRDILLPGPLGSRSLSAENMELDAVDAGVARARPLLYAIPPIVHNIPQVRVVLTYHHTELYKHDPVFLEGLVQVARHGLPIVKSVYSPDAKNLQAESVLLQHGSSYGLAAGDWFESDPDHSLQALQIMLKEPVEKVPSYITLQATSLFLSVCSNVLDIQTEQERMLQRVYLSSLIASERSRFEQWIEGTLTSEEEIVSFPTHLSLASIPCVLSTLWTTLPLCSCCLDFTCIAACQKSNVIFEFLQQDALLSPLVSQWLFETKGCKIIACPNILDCRHSHKSANSSQPCTCLANAAILFPFHLTVPLTAPQALRNSVKQQVFSVK